MSFRGTLIAHPHSTRHLPHFPFTLIFFRMRRYLSVLRIFLRAYRWGVSYYLHEGHQGRRRLLWICVIQFVFYFLFSAF